MLPGWTRAEIADAPAAELDWLLKIDEVANEVELQLAEEKAKKAHG